MLAKGSVGKVFNVYGNVILFWFLYVVLENFMYYCIG